MKTVKICLLISAIMLCPLSSLFSMERKEEETLKNNVKLYLKDQKKPTVLYGALEGADAIVGGLGIVVRDVSKNFSNLNDINFFTLTPYYGFFNTKAPSLKSLGFFQHRFFDRPFKTEVFYKKEGNQFLFKPDVRLRDCCEIVTDPSLIYEQEQMYPRLVFFNSAIAEFSNLLNADVVHLNSWHTALSGHLIKEKYNPKRLQKNTAPIQVVSTFHMLSEEQGHDTNVLYQHVGIKSFKGLTVNLAQDAIRFSDQVIGVSQELNHCFRDKDATYGLYKSFHKKKKALLGITNGIQYENFNPYSSKILGDFALPVNFDLKDLKETKKKAKEALFKDHHLIGNPTLPLMLYVGRLSDEKGVSFLTPITEEWLRLGGQMVVMGLLTQDEVSTRKIMDLKERFKTNPLLKIYTDFLPPQKGSLIRFSADFLCMPSRVESCGLVAMESLSLGTLVFTSWVQGLKDMCLPRGVYHPHLQKVITDEEWNAISYYYHSGDEDFTIKDLNKKLQETYALVGAPLLLKAQERAIKSAYKFDWNANGGAIQSHKTVYESLIEKIKIKYPRSFLPIETPPPFTKASQNLTEKLIKKMGEYPKEQVFFHNDTFILSSLKIVERRPESEKNQKNLDKKKHVTIKNFQLYHANGSLFNYQDTPTTYVISEKGDLLIGADCHADFLKFSPGHPFYGYGEMVACAGDIKIKNGRITYIDNRSGHYKTRLEQFGLALHFLKEKQILGTNTKIKSEAGDDMRYLLQEDRQSFFNTFPHMKELGINE